MSTPWGIYCLYILNSIYCIVVHFHFTAKLDKLNWPCWITLIILMALSTRCVSGTPHTVQLISAFSFYVWEHEFKEVKWPFPSHGCEEAESTCYLSSSTAPAKCFLHSRENSHWVPVVISQHAFEKGHWPCVSRDIHTHSLRMFLHLVIFVSHSLSAS